VIASFETAAPSLNLPEAELAQYLLVCHARNLSLTHGVWCFSLETLAGTPLLEAEDEEEGDLNRLSLLAAVRGLEAIDGRGMVSLISNNRYLIRSLDQSLPRWRENDFVWENFGRKIAVQNADLWRRIDRTLAIHHVTASLVQTTRVSGHDGSLPITARAPRELDDSFPVIRVDAGHGDAVSAPTDRLRRWLAGHDDLTPRPGRRGRYRPADWAGEAGN
jgi:ribonuclease HI